MQFNISRSQSKQLVNKAKMQEFQPSNEQLRYMPLFKQGIIPRYLFRLHSPSTAGFTSRDLVQSPASLRDSRKSSISSQDIFRLPWPVDAAEQLSRHLQWDPSHEETCNLMSWTSSLLVALYYSRYKHFISREKAPWQELHLLIVDTRHLPSAAFVKDLEIMDALFDKENSPLCQLRNIRQRKNNRFYFGEYLSQGSLELRGQGTQVCIYDLMQHGLTKLFPELSIHEPDFQWALAVKKHRKEFFQPQSQLSIHPKGLRNIIAMSETFFTNFSLPMTLMFLSLRGRQSGIATLQNGIRGLFDRE